MSLDLEGGEYDALKSIDFNKTDITTLLIEINDKKRLLNLMEEKRNYKLIFEYYDLYYLKQ